MNQRKEDAAVLADAAITLWVPGDDTENQSAFDSALTEFREVYPQILLEITYIPEEEYASRLAEALAEDKLPTLFESSSIEVTDDRSWQRSQGYLSIWTQADICFWINIRNIFRPKSRYRWRLLHRPSI